MDESRKAPVRRPYGLDVYYWAALDFRTGKEVLATPAPHLQTPQVGAGAV